MAGDEAVGRPARGAPAGAGGAVVVAGIEAQAGDRQEEVVGAGIDRDPLALALLAPGVEIEAREGGVDEAGTVKRVARGARAVVALVVPFCVAAAPQVG